MDVPFEPLKRRVKRDATGKTPVKLKTQDGGLEVDLMNVWIIWCEKSGSDPVSKVSSSKRLIYQTEEVDAIIRIEASSDIFFKVKPESILRIEDDIPDLLRVNDTKSPGADTKHFLRTNAPMDDATRKWDVSRRLGVTVKTTGVLPPEFYTSVYTSPMGWYSGGAGTFQVLAKPEDALIGNDDPPAGRDFGIVVEDESVCPYREVIYRPYAEVAWVCPQGYLLGVDRPALDVKVSWGKDNEVGDKVEVTYNFDEFCRLELGSDAGASWFRVSEDVSWNFYLKFEVFNLLMPAADGARVPVIGFGLDEVGADFGYYENE